MLDTGLRHHLMTTALGTIRYESGDVVYPPWRDQMIAIASATRDITIGDIDAVFAQRFLINHNPRMNDFELVGEPGADIEVFGDFATDQLLAHVIAINFNEQYAPDDEKGSVYINRVYHQEFVQEYAPYLMLRVLSTMWAMTGTSFGEILEKNYKKITGRIAAGKIDHADGERSPDLL